MDRLINQSITFYFRQLGPYNSQTIKTGQERTGN